MEITQILVKELFEYQDGKLIWKVDRGVNKTKGNVAGYLHLDSNRHKLRIDNKPYFVSRIVFLWHKGYLPEFVDHENRDTTNDRIENLRDASRSQNGKNRTSSRNSSSKYLGVNKHGKNWQCQIFINKKNMNLGHFKTQEEAALIYNKAAVKHHGEFANLNIINN